MRPGTSTKIPNPPPHGRPTSHPPSTAATIFTSLRPTRQRHARSSDCREAVGQVDHRFAAFLALGVEVEIVEEFGEADVSLQSRRGGKIVASGDEVMWHCQLLGEQSQRPPSDQPRWSRLGRRGSSSASTTPQSVRGDIRARRCHHRPQRHGRSWRTRGQPNQRHQRGSGHRQRTNSGSRPEPDRQHLDDPPFLVMTDSPYCQDKHRRLASKTPNPWPPSRTGVPPPGGFPLTRYMTRRDSPVGRLSVIYSRRWRNRNRSLTFRTASF